MRRLLLAAPLAVLLAAIPAAAQAPAGRLAEATGAVALRPPGGAWAPAPTGTPLQEAQTLRTGPRAHAELDLGPNRLGLDPETVLRIDSAHPGMPAFTLEQGRAMVLLRSLRPGQVARIHLPGGNVTLAEPGLYVVTVPEAGRPGSVGVSRGLAQVHGPGISLAVPQGQTGLFGGPQPASLRQGVAEGFLADDPSPPPPQVVTPAAPPPDLAALPGTDPLRQQGSWVDQGDYGTVWYPPVPAGWSPYADPWQPDRWGHVPYSSGAWIMIGPRWAWMPPRRVPPPAWRHAHPPPGLGHRPPPVVAPVPAPNPFPAAPHVVAPRPAAAPAMLPPMPSAGPLAPLPGQPRPPLAAPTAAPPAIAPLPATATPAPRPPQPTALPPVAAPSPAPAAPHVFTPRPSPAPAALPSPAIAAPRPAPPPIAAPPPRPAAPPPRTCPPGRTVC